MKIIYYDKKPHAEIDDLQAMTITDTLTSPNKPTHIEINGELLRTMSIEIRERQEEAAEERKIFQLTTEKIKKELGPDLEKFYDEHATGQYDFKCMLMTREDTGIIKILLQQGIIGEEEAQYKDQRFKYQFIKNLERYNKVERQLELLRELRSRRSFAKREEKMAQMRLQINQYKQTA